MNMEDELLEEWKLSVDKPTKRFKELLGQIAVDRFNKYTKEINLIMEYWVKDYIVQGVIKNRTKFNEDKGEIVTYFTNIADGYAFNITDKLIKKAFVSKEED